MLREVVHGRPDTTDAVARSLAAGERHSDDAERGVLVDHQGRRIEALGRAQRDLQVVRDTLA